MPFKAALQIWLDHVLAQKEMLDKEGFFEDAAIGASFVDASHKLFCDDVQAGLPAFLLRPDGNLFQLSGLICKYFDQQDLEIDFASFRDAIENLFAIEVETDGVHIELFDDETELLLEFFGLPKIEHCIFPFLDPVYSVVDCRAHTFVSKLMASDDDPLQLARMEMNVDEDGSITLPPTAIFKFASLADMQTGYLEVKRHLQNPFEKYAGESVCFSDQHLRGYITKVYPMDARAIEGLIAAETEAERRFRAHMGQNPQDTFRRENAYQMFCRDLGTRAAKRVWDKVSSDYPHLRRPGPKKTRS